MNVVYTLRSDWYIWYKKNGPGSIPTVKETDGMRSWET